MAHFACIDNNNVVTSVVVVDNVHVSGDCFEEAEEKGRQYLAGCGLSGTWLQTSYNNHFRRRFAGIGMTYSKEHDAFCLPQPFPSWILDLGENDDWSAPVPKPDDPDYHWTWDEEGQTWIGNKKPQIPNVVTLGE